MLQIIKEEIVPLSSRQQLILLIIIACIFQFVLFYAPALADEAVNQAKAENAELITNDSIIKDADIDKEASKLASPVENRPSASGPALTPNPASPAAVRPGDKTPAAPPANKVLKTSVHVITAYNSEAAQTDDDPCTTANGFNVCKHGQEDTIAANFLKFGTKVQIPELFGDRVFVVRDRMNKKHPDRVDVWMKEKHAAIHFGVKTAKIQVIE